MDAHARLAMEVGILPENIFIPKKAPSWNMTMGTSFQLVASLQEMSHRWECHWGCWKCRPRDRKVLSEDGIFIVAITVNRREKTHHLKGKSSHPWLCLREEESRYLARKCRNCQPKCGRILWPRTASIGASSRVPFVIVWPNTSLTRPNVDQLSCQLSWKYAKINIRGKVDRRLFLSKKKEMVRKDRWQ